MVRVTWNWGSWPGGFGTTLIYGCFRKWWKKFPQIIHFNRVFDYKPSIFGGFPPIFGNTHMSEVNKVKVLLPVVRDLVMECYGHMSLKIQQNGLNFSWACEGVDRFTRSNTLEKISIDSPWAWSADADLCQEKSGASQFCCLKITPPLWSCTTSCQICQMQDRWDGVLNSRLESQHKRRSHQGALGGMFLSATLTEVKPSPSTPTESMDSSLAPCK